MLNILSYFNFDEVHIAVCIIFSVVVLYECKFGEPITYVFGKPKLFEGTTIQKILSWITFTFLILNFLWII